MQRREMTCALFVALVTGFSYMGGGLNAVRCSLQFIRFTFCQSRKFWRLYMILASADTVRHERVQSRTSPQGNIDYPVQTRIHTSSLQQDDRVGGEA